MRRTGHAVIVGAGPAGVVTAETLRSEGFRGEVTLIGEEPALPYERPPLSRQVLSGAWDLDRTRLRSPDHFVDLGIDLRLGTLAIDLDVTEQKLLLTGGEMVSYDHLVIATGVVPRRLPNPQCLRGVHVLRSRHDLVSLQETLAVAHRVVIIGAGFLGTEVASVLVSRLEVTLVDPQPAPMACHLGPRVGSLIADMHRTRDVDIAMGVGVRTITGRDGRVSSVQLTDGRALAADAVLVAIGATSAVDWLRSSSLPLADGVVCDQYCRAAPNVYAAGDVASWPNLRYGGQRMRVAHRHNATQQGQVVARNITAEHPTAFTPVPSFWSDQFTTRIQGFGLLPPGADVEFVDGLPGEPHFVALYSVDGQLTGAVAWNHPRRALVYQQTLAGSWIAETQALASGDPT